MSRQDYITSQFAAGTAAYLLGGDGFRADRRSPLGRQWAAWLANLVNEGWMRRSKTGRYWWV